MYRFDGSSATVAKLLSNSGFKSAYAIKGGAEGSNGWNVGLSSRSKFLHQYIFVVNDHFNFHSSTLRILSQ